MTISKSLRSRSVTGIVFVVLVLALILINSWTYLGLLALIMWMCAFEWCKMNALINPMKGVITSVLTGLFISLCIWGQEGMMIICGIVLLILIILNLSSTRDLNQLFIISATSLLYFIFPLFLAYDLSMIDMDYTYNRVLFPVLLIWVNDVFAYVIGSLIGRHKMIPRISPNKTWEGTLGGIVLCGLSAILIKNTLGVEIQYVFIFGVFIGILSTLGDLFESALKRNFGVKDSGDILPGHGGFMDRFDSFLIVMPFAWMYWNFVV